MNMARMKNALSGTLSSSLQGQPEPRNEDVVKKGYLRKRKNMNIRYFVLRKANRGHPSCLEYYENEKSFLDGIHYKKKIDLNNTCFNISQKWDQKCSYVIAIYVKRDCHSLVANNSVEMEEWLRVLNEHHKMRTDEMPEKEPAPTNDYEHVWQVEVLDRGLASATNNGLAGVARICLTSKSISLVNVNDFTKKTEIELTSIRECGYISEFFSLSIGRRAATGCGLLWMKTEDTFIAQNMKNIVHVAMTNVGRSRTQSFSESTFAHHVPRDRCHTLPSRERTNSDGTHNDTNIHHPAHWQPMLTSNPQTHFSSIESEMDNGSNTNLSERLPTENNQETENYLPMGRSQKRPNDTNLSNRLSMGQWDLPSNYSTSDTLTSSNQQQNQSEDGNYLVMSSPDADHHQDSTTPTTTRSPPPLTDLNAYMVMTPEPKFQHQQGSSLGGDEDYSNYLKMDQGDESYMMMGGRQDPISPSSGSHLLKLPSSQVTSPTTSGTHSRTPSLVDDSSSSYLPMNVGISSHYTNSAPTPIPLSPSEADSFPEMSPESGSSSFTSGTHDSDQRIHELADLDKSGTIFHVSEDDDMLSLDRPIRTSSVGSKPDQYKSRMNRLEVNSSDSTRVRAFSVGSKVPFKSASNSTGVSSVPPTSARGTSDLTPGEENGSCAKNKSTSAPLLGSSSVSHSWSGTPGNFFPRILNKANDRHCHSDYMEIEPPKRNSDHHINEEKEKKFRLFNNFSILPSRNRSNSKSSNSSKKEKKHSEGDISLTGIEIPNGRAKDRNYCQMDFNPSPRSQTSDSSENYMMMDQTGASMSHSSYGSGYLPMRPGVNVSGRYSSEPDSYMDMCSSLSSSGSKDEYVDMSGANSASSPSVNPDPSQRTRKISTVLSPLDISSPSEDCIDSCLSQSYSNGESLRKKDRKNKRSGRSFRDKRSLDSLGRSQSDADSTNNEGSKGKTSSSIFSSITNKFTRKSSQAQTKILPSPQTSPVPKSTRTSSSPFSSLTRSRSKESKEGRDGVPTTPRIDPSSIQEDAHEPDDCAINKQKNPFNFNASDQKYKVLVDNSEQSKRNSIIESIGVNETDSVKKDLKSDTSCGAEKSLPLLTKQHASACDLKYLEKEAELSSKRLSGILQNSCTNSSSITSLSSSQNTLASPPRRASTGWMFKQSENPYVNISPNDSSTNPRRASTGKSPFALSNTSSPVHLQQTSHEQREYVNFSLSSKNLIENTKMLDLKTKLGNTSSFDPSSSAVINEVKGEDEPGDYMMMDMSQKSSSKKVVKKPDLPTKLLNLKVNPDLTLDKLNISEPSQSSSERLRSHSGPQIERKPSTSTEKDVTNEGRAASACSSPVSFSPPSSPTLGSVSSMSSLSEGGLSSASSTCTVVNLGLPKTGQTQSPHQHSLIQTQTTQKEDISDSLPQQKEAMLNYVSLDLTQKNRGSSPRVTNRLSNIPNAGESTSTEEPANYTQIDFLKSEGLHTTSLARNNEKQ